eukprot:TRINITY_DN195_c0_g1_i2.p2 TRINITY_DN195_c0_g1~~TRINITY_DN195_c0_g1_i2.p2  ORF type:complete len:339 (+),score=129.24 TRINITY_DN195_c0_g1_i2:96-1019(+)
MPAGAMTMHDMETLGVFQQPSYISIGDEYDKKNAISERLKGKGFTTAPGRRGQGPDICFSKDFKSLHEGDKFVDPGTHEKKYRLEQAKKKLTPEGFRYTSPSKKASGSGGYFGCFTTTIQHQTEYDVLQKGELPEKSKAQMRNVITNPPRKGTFGTPGTNIGKGTEYQYISDPYDAEHRKELAEARGAAKKVAGTGPFKSACRRQGTFDETAAGASKVYSLDRALPPKKPVTGPNRAPLPQPFKPSSPGKRGFNCTINRFPEYKEDPLEIQERRRREEMKAAKPQTVWRPISGQKSMPYKSVALAAP